MKQCSNKTAIMRQKSCAVGMRNCNAILRNHLNWRQIISARILLLPMPFHTKILIHSKHPIEPGNKSSPHLVCYILNFCISIKSIQWAQGIILMAMHCPFCRLHNYVMLGFLNSNREMLGASLLDCMQSKHCFIYMYNF